MDPVAVLASVFAVHLLATVSPGPNFIVVARAALSQSRTTGIATAAGIATGSLMWACAANLGLAVAISRSAWLYDMLRLAGGLYLAWAGLQLWRPSGAAAHPTCDTARARRTVRQAFRSGLLTNLANPKSAIFFGAIFASFLTPALPAWVSIASVAVVFVNALLWYAAVACIVSAPHTRTRYLQISKHIDRLAGAILVLSALRLVASAGRA